MIIYFDSENLQAANAAAKIEKSLDDAKYRARTAAVVSLSNDEFRSVIQGSVRILGMPDLGSGKSQLGESARASSDSSGLDMTSFLAGTVLGAFAEK